MLRRAVLGFGALLLVAGLALSLASRSPAGVLPAGVGLALLLAILLERRGYQRIVDQVPGPDWQPTGESFFEPGSGTPVSVYFHPASGRQAYVRLPRPPAAEAG
jgi:hypothetical protein